MLPKNILGGPLHTWVLEQMDPGRFLLGNRGNEVTEEEKVACKKL